MRAIDRLALADMVHRYAAGVDDRRFDDVVDLFTADAELAVPDPPRSLEPVAQRRGRDAVRDALAAVAAADRTQHAIVGEVFLPGVDTDHARGRIACIAHHWTRRGDQITDVAWHMRYDDEYVRTGAGWRFARRVLTIDAIETRPVRRLRDPSPRL